jgi:hypothetical protein
MEMALIDETQIRCDRGDCLAAAHSAFGLLEPDLQVIRVEGQSERALKLPGELESTEPRDLREVSGRHGFFDLRMQKFTDSIQGIQFQCRSGHSRPRIPDREVTDDMLEALLGLQRRRRFGPSDPCRIDLTG